MADIIWTDVVAVAPELATDVSADFQTMVLAYVNTVVAPAQFGGEDSIIFKLARAYLAAHYASLFVDGSLGGAQMTSMSEGGVSASFSVDTAGGENALSSTTYGDTFLTFVRRSPARAGFVT